MNQIDLITSACETAMTKFDASACQLCSEWVPPLEEATNLREFRRHFARHLQQISLEALPLHIEGLTVQEDPDRDETFEFKKGIVLSDCHGLFDNAGFYCEKGDEVLILDNMFDEDNWHVRRLKTGEEDRIPGGLVKLIGSTAIPLGKRSTCS